MMGGADLGAMLQGMSGPDAQVGVGRGGGWGWGVRCATYGLRGG
jgi:hypothetical protein